MHLDDLLGDGKTKAGSAFGLGIGVVDLVELLEYALLLFQGLMVTVYSPLSASSMILTIESATL